MQERFVSVYIFRYKIYNIISIRVASSCVNSGSWSKSFITAMDNKFDMVNDSTPLIEFYPDVKYVAPGIWYLISISNIRQIYNIL